MDANTPNTQVITPVTPQSTEPSAKAIAIAKSMHKTVEEPVIEVAPEVKSEPAPEVKAEPKVEDKPKEDKVEEKPPEKKEDKQEDKVDDKVVEKIASRFAALSRKEKALREQKEQLDTKSAKYKELENLIELSKTDPMETLKKLGITYEQLTSAILKGDKNVEIGKLTKMEKENADLKAQMNKFIEDQKNAERDRTIKEAESKYKAEIKSTLTAAGDKFELLNMHENPVDIVFNIIDADLVEKKALADKEGREITLKDALTFEQAAQMAETYYEHELSPFTKAKKFNKSEPPRAPESKTETPEVTKAETPTSPSTLTNDLVNKAPATKKILTRDEEISVTTDRFKGKLFKTE